MKVRFLRDRLTAYIASQIEVETVEELHNAIRREKNLPPDFDLAGKIHINRTPDADPGLTPTYQIVFELRLIGYCDGPLKDIQDKVKTPLPEGPYYIDTNRVEHTCCYRSAVVRRLTDAEKKTGKHFHSTLRIAEGDKQTMKLVRDALNFYHTNFNKQDHENANTN
jgi:hypothetical protein